jgi:hypothetical protein
MKIEMEQNEVVYKIPFFKIKKLEFILWYLNAFYSSFSHLIK